MIHCLDRTYSYPMISISSACSSTGCAFISRAGPLVLRPVRAHFSRTDLHQSCFSSPFRLFNPQTRVHLPITQSRTPSSSSFPKMTIGDEDNIFNVVWCSDASGKSELRTKTRPDHLTWAVSDAIHIEIGGPLRNEHNEVEGSLLITKNLNPGILVSDPYAKVGLFEKTVIGTWRLTIKADGDLPKSMYMVWNKDKPNSASLRAATRPAHLEWIDSAKKNRIISVVGPMLDESSEFQQHGTFLLCQAKSIDDAKQFASSDPYAKTGLFISTEVKQFTKIDEKRKETQQSPPCTRRQLLKHTAALSIINLISLLNNPNASGAVKGRGLDKGAAEQVLLNAKYPTDWPYTNSDFRRYDETKDSEFYSSPRYTRHIDIDAVNALIKYHTKNFKPGDDILDLCASIESYAPPSMSANIIGLGMNQDELRSNPRLSSWDIRDLNVNPVLPYADKSFDVVICALSIDYLVKPLQVCNEIARVLKPNGQVHISFSDRVFSTKAVQIWMSSNNEDHIYIVASYLHYCRDKYENIQVDDISPRRFGNSLTGNPLYVVSAKRTSQ